MEHDNNPVSTTSDPVITGRISPMDCDSDTDVNQTSQGDIRDSMDFENETREEDDRSDSDMSSSSTSFQYSSTTLNTDSLNNDQSINTPDDNSSTGKDHSLANNQSTFTGEEGETSASSSCETPERPRQPDTVNETLISDQKTHDTQHKTGHGNESVSNSNQNSLNLQKQTENYKDEIKQSNFDGSEKSTPIQSITNTVDSNKQYKEQGSDMNSNYKQPHSISNYIPEPVQHPGPNYQLDYREIKPVFDGAYHDDPLENLKPIQIPLCTSPVKTQLIDTKGMVNNSPTGFKETQQKVSSYQQSIQPIPIPNPNLAPWPYQANERPPYPVNDPPVARTQRYRPPGINSMYLYPNEPTGFQQSRHMDYYCHPGHEATGAQNFPNEPIDYQYFQGGPKRFSDQQTGFLQNSDQYTGGQPYYHSTNTLGSQNEAQRSTFRQTNTLVEQNCSYSHGAKNNFSQNVENPKVQTSRGEAPMKQGTSMIDNTYSPPAMERTNIDHSDKGHDDKINNLEMVRRNRQDVREVPEIKEKNVQVKKDETKNVLIESTTEPLEFQRLKIALSNKKKSGGPIEALQYDPEKKQYLVTFEDSRDAHQIVNTNFKVSDVPLRLCLYWEDPENFVKEQKSQILETKQKAQILETKQKAQTLETKQKSQTFEKKQKAQTLVIKVKSLDILRVKHILQNEKILSRFYRRLKLKCEFKSVKQQDAGEYLIAFDLNTEFTEDLQDKSKDAAEILKSIADELTQTIITVPDGINLKLQIKELNKESTDVSLTFTGQKIYFVRKSQETVSEYERKIHGMIKEVQDELKRNNEEIDKIKLEPLEKMFFQKFLLESDELKENDVLLGIVEDGVTVKCQKSYINEAMLYINESMNKVSSLKKSLYDNNSSEYLFLKECKYIDKIESQVRERKLKVCIGFRKDEFVILSLDRNDITQAESIVKESISTQTFPIDTTQFLQSKEWQSLVSTIKEEFGSDVMIQTNAKACKMTIVGDSSIVRRVSDQIKDYLESITEITDVLSADFTKMDYIRRYCYNDIRDIQKMCSLDIDCHVFPWKLRGTKAEVERGKFSVMPIIENVKTDTIVMKFIGIGTLFTQQRGNEIISRIGEDSRCLIVEEKKSFGAGTSERPPPLKQWTLVNDKKIEVVKADMRYLNCDAIVNAANGRLKHGAGLAGAIVEMGGYEIQKYSDEYVKNKGEVKVGEVMVGSPGKLLCKKIIHAVGPVWRGGSGNEKSLLENAVKNSLRAADNNNLNSIAIPAISTGIFGFPMADACKVIVKTIVNYFNKSTSSVNQVLLCDIKEDSLTAFIRCLTSELGEQNKEERKEKVREESLGAVGGVSESDHSDTDETSDAEDKESNHDDDDYEDDDDDDEGSPQTSQERDNDAVGAKMKVKSGEITKQQVDVIVNCTSGELNLKSGAVSKAILEAAGSSIQSECDKTYSGGISPGAIAVTSGGKLSCKKIYHTCIQSYIKDKSQAKKSLEIFISRSLESATKSEFESIAFPALGCGRLGFPADVSASIVFETTKTFLKKTPRTSIKEIIFVIHPKDSSVLKAYSEIGKDFNVSTTVTKTSNRNGKISYGKIDVEICQGDLTRESTDCIVNVCTNSMELKYGISKLISEKGGSEIAEECSKRKYEIKKDGILITGSGNLGCSAICHLVIQKSPEDWQKIIKNALYKMNKDGHESASIPAIGTGGLKVNPKTSAEFIMSALKSYGEKVRSPNLTKIRIVIYQKEHVQEFLKVFSVGHRNHHTASSSKRRGFRKFNKKPRKDMNEIKLIIYSDSLINIEEAKKKLHDRFRDEMETKKIPEYLQDIIEKLKSNQRDELKDIAESFYVKIKFDKSSKVISLNGLTKQVRDCCDQIIERLQGWKSTEQKSSEKAILSKYVDWVYEEKSGGRTHSFGPGITAKLEKARIEKLREIEISDPRGRTYMINLKEMKEYPKHGSPVKIFRIEKGGTKGHKLLKGEKEALSGSKTVYFELKPKRTYDDSKPEENHFRLAESQFCRLLNNSAQYYVTKVEYVVNPVLNKKFRAAQQELKSSSGETNSLPVLAFHGTNVKNIQSICENGFKMQGDQGFTRNTSGAQYYGDGVYFSEYPDYSMGYIKGETKILLNQVLPGRSFTCTALRGSNSQVESGYDSHISSDKKELVIFKTERILPCYIVHYTTKSGDYQYK